MKLIHKHTLKGIERKLHIKPVTLVSHVFTLELLPR